MQCKDKGPGQVDPLYTCASTTNANALPNYLHRLFGASLLLPWPCYKGWPLLLKGSMDDSY